MAKRYTKTEELEIYREPEIHDIAGTYQGGIIIVGGGKNMWQEWKEARELFPSFDVMGVNVAGMFLPHPVTHLFSWHAKQLSHIKGWRLAEIPDDKALTHSVREYDRINYVWNFNGNSSVSGLTGIELAYLLGYTKILLVGIPMDNTGYFYQTKENFVFSDRDRTKEIHQVGQKVGYIIRSMSGLTQQIYGSPDIGW